ncbi:MAG: DUF86 domain-containing protein [Roseiflexus sp.]|jgi:uncharacterized protein YutE (UPF0331/DUF86 family)|uniref:type VII toxin-antitoxin system HepT family RNase toxin n=1 Tax=Roseiflexus sp. TaxID=2562120 RepID=UPI0025F3E922|nr:DUF86 domain-containing protein [Roseiflexus sp.]MCL6540185.1 DUF86 domain-containing protein [Roseiflexus sp.]
MTGALTIARHLAQLQVYVAQLRELQQHSRADLDQDWRIRATVDRTLQLAIEVVISVCDQLIAGLSLPLPDSGHDAVLNVARAGVISDDPGARLARMVGFRNILVHQSMSIDYDRVYEVLQHERSAFEQFLSQVGAFLDAQNLP